MRKLKLFPFFLGCSFFIHTIVVFSCSLYIDGNAVPEIYSWSNILGKGDLYSSKKDIIFPAGVDFSLDSSRRQYFSSFEGMPFLYSKTGGSMPEAMQIIPAFSDVRKEVVLQKLKGYKYLWRSDSKQSSQTPKSLLYNAYVSPYGKVFFIYPERLPADSQQSLHLQEHIRESIFFLNDKFLWTKVESVVQ
ncbi:MAG: hypothetical protein PHU64_00850 [Candidatus Omnitrophica bacterium]|nr:hypothetical protein [Candidatus Omnitrophota bacterium]MDD5430372.1 hypothetical protein [Candidatus Omnitrophota bacterium]